jgi:AraC-like DNA-binding protein
MQSHLKSQLNMSQVADFFGMEVHFLMRLFNKHLGVSPMKYFQQLKMEEAKHLVVGSILPIKVIALNLGFRDSLYFSTAFRRYFGVSPSEFRRQHQQHFD